MQIPCADTVSKHRGQAPLPRPTMHQMHSEPARHSSTEREHSTPRRMPANAQPIPNDEVLLWATSVLFGVGPTRSRPTF